MRSDKAKRAVQIYVENRGISKGEAMRRAGYADATAKNPRNLTQSRTWKELMDEQLPDEKLIDKHNSLLEAKKLEKAEFPAALPHAIIRDIILEAGCTPRNFETNRKTGITYVWYWAPDHRAQASALDLAYKLKGKLTQKVEHSGNVPVAMVEFLGDDESADGQDSVS